MIPSEAITLIDEITKQIKKLSRWERGFVASVSIQAKQNRLLSGQQSDKLQQIYRKASGG